jgi:hypothetical protein
MGWKVRCAHQKLVPVSDLKKHPKNPNDHSDEQITRLAQILEYQGWRSPIKVSLLSGFITAGHGRLAAAIKGNQSVVPVDFQEYESEEQEYADVVSDNAIALWAELDLKQIGADILDYGPDFNINILGLQDFQLDVPLFEPGTEDDQGQLDEKTPIECPHCGKTFIKN